MTSVKKVLTGNCFKILNSLNFNANIQRTDVEKKTEKKLAKRNITQAATVKKCDCKTNRPSSPPFNRVLVEFQ